MMKTMMEKKEYR